MPYVEETDHANVNHSPTIQHSAYAVFDFVLIYKLEIRSVECGICPIATSTINERTVPIIMAGCMAHEREGHNYRNSSFINCGRGYGADTTFHRTYF